VSRTSLPHGYTNVSWADGREVHKRYVGIGAQARMRTELEALREIADLVPTPRVLAVDDETATVTFARVAGRHGQELIDEGHAAEVLRGAGRTLRELHGSSAPDVAVFVQGDYGPQNLLFDADSFDVVAVAQRSRSLSGRAVERIRARAVTVVGQRRRNIEQ
jgi:tRNA A-37 threonylcarbamoyl transferase component Bud32